MDQNDSGAVPGRALFEATRWSVVLQAAQSRAAGGPEALAQLCKRYWPPLYAFARHRGNAQEDAQDLVQGFFEHLLQTQALATVDQAKGRFRSFLLASIKNYMAMQYRRAEAEKRGGRAEIVRIDWQDAEQRIAFEPVDTLSPETLYDARWALELLGRATRRLEQEQKTLGKSQAYRTLRPFLGDQEGGESLSYETAAQRLSLGIPTLKTWVHRLRRRHAQLLREEVALTVLKPEEVDAEVHALCEALVKAQGRLRTS